MAAATQADLVRQVLQELSILSGGQPVEDEDAALVIERIISCNEQLRDLEICYWSDDVVPQAVKNWLAVYVACYCAGPLWPGNPTDAAQYQAANEKKAEMKLREIVANRMRMDEPTPGTYF